jgi:hypothetical protein
MSFLALDSPTTSFGYREQQFCWNPGVGFTASLASIKKHDFLSSYRQCDMRLQSKVLLFVYAICGRIGLSVRLRTIQSHVLHIVYCPNQSISRDVAAQESPGKEWGGDNLRMHTCLFECFHAQRMLPTVSTASGIKT